MVGLPWLPFIAAFTAVLPDIVRDVWRAIFYLGPGRRGIEFRRGPITRFHRWIQWGERPWGLIVEIIFGVTLISIVGKLNS
jgi:hypothetical protein